MFPESFLNRLSLILMVLIFTKCWGAPVPRCAATAHRYAALFRRLPKQKWFCIGISSRHIPTMRRTGSLPSALLEQTISGDGEYRPRTRAQGASAGDSSPDCSKDRLGF